MLLTRLRVSRAPAVLYVTSATTIAGRKRGPVALPLEPFDPDYSQSTTRSVLNHRAVSGSHRTAVATGCPSFDEFPDKGDDQFRLVELHPMRAPRGYHMTPVS